jgi:hypothetical protein
MVLEQFIDAPEMLTDYLMWVVIIGLFSAFTENVQRATLEIGRKISTTDSLTGLQDAITPKWQTRNNIINLFAQIYLLALSIYLFKWYVGIIVFLLIYFIATPLIRKFLMFSPQSEFILKKIISNLEKNKSLYETSGDDLRLQAINDVIARVNKYKSE